MDDFAKWFNQKIPEIKRVNPPIVTDYVLTLYRGFNHLPEDMILRPELSEQGLIWFTHQFIVGYDAIQYAADHGQHLLTYKLPCKRHIQTTEYEDGSHYDGVPKDIAAKTTPVENCQFFMGIELPAGWVFSYKTEKFVGCSKPLRISADMITDSKTLIDKIRGD